MDNVKRLIARKDNKPSKDKDLDSNPAQYDKNVFSNNILYFQKYQELETKCVHLQQLNAFLTKQVLSQFSSEAVLGFNQIVKKNLSNPPKPERKGSVKFEDDRSLNKLFQLFQLLKGLLDNGDQMVRRISEEFFPATFDFESELYSKNYQKLLSTVLKSAVNSIIFYQNEKTMTKRKASIGHSDKKGEMGRNTTVVNKEGKERLLHIGTSLTGSSVDELFPDESGLKNVLQAECLSLGKERVDDGLFSQSFLNQTDIRKNLINPLLQLCPKAEPVAASRASTIDKGCQTGGSQLEFIVLAENTNSKSSQSEFEIVP